jgi:hypothetical protein
VAGMGLALGLGLNSPGAAGEVDPSFANVSLLLHMDGTNGSTTFSDNSSNNFSPATVDGNVQLSTTDPKFGTAAGLFDGNGDFLTYGSNVKFAFGTGDYTVEFWMKSTAGNGTPICQPVNGNGWALIFLSNVAYLQSSYNSINAVQVVATPFLDGNWHHVAICRSGTSLRLFLDGVQQGATATSSNNYTAQTISIGSGPNFYNGRLDELRITKGVARYTANFTPPSAAFPNS